MTVQRHCKCFFVVVSEHTLKVKETYCTITGLVPNTQYEFWVNALNASGISPPSERAVYVTGKNILFAQLCDLHSEIQNHL